MNFLFYSPQYHSEPHPFMRPRLPVPHAGFLRQGHTPGHRLPLSHSATSSRNPPPLRALTSLPVISLSASGRPLPACSAPMARGRVEEEARRSNRAPARGRGCSSVTSSGVEESPADWPRRPLFSPRSPPIGLSAAGQPIGGPDSGRAAPRQRRLGAGGVCGGGRHVGVSGGAARGWLQAGAARGGPPGAAFSGGHEAAAGRGSPRCSCCRPGEGCGGRRRRAGSVLGRRPRRLSGQGKRGRGRRRRRPPGPRPPSAAGRPQDAEGGPAPRSRRGRRAPPGLSAAAPPPSTRFSVPPRLRAAPPAPLASSRPAPPAETPPPGGGSGAERLLPVRLLPRRRGSAGGGGRWRGC